MKTAAILNFWDCGELLPYAVKNWFKCVDEVIIVYSNRSNYGEFIDNDSFLRYAVVGRAHCINCEPIQLGPRQDETRKRNYGIDYARELGVTHFVLTDADEFYDPLQFSIELKRFEDPSLKGLVCACRTYFSSPKLTIGIDENTRVSFIHKMTSSLRAYQNLMYPFAFERRNIKIDPTRQFNIRNGVEWSPIIMEHYSWVRKDYQKKIRNSTAKANLERSTILNDLVQAKEGYFCQYYGKTLVRASVYFNIPEYEFNEGGNATVRQDL